MESQQPAGSAEGRTIFATQEIPWEEIGGVGRRQVLFSGQLTFVILEASGPTSGPIPLHNHVNDQITYVLDGEIEVQIGEEIRKVSKGSFYRVPPNVPHGMRILTPLARLADAFTPPREDFRRE